MNDSTQLVVTRRLRSAYWPELVQKIAFDIKAIGLKPVGYVSDKDRVHVLHYDVRRVLRLMNEFRAGKPWEPIQIDCQWHNNSPVRPVILDGHHRFAAAVFLKERAIAADYGGPVEMINWLAGKTRKVPTWIYEGGFYERRESAR